MDVLIRASVPNHYSFYEALRQDFQECPNVEVVWRKKLRVGKLDAISYLMQALRSRERKSHLVVEEYLSTGALLVFWLVLLVFRRVSLEVAVHNMNSWFMIGWPFTVKRGLRGLAKRLLTSRAAGLIVVSQDLAEYGREIMPSVAIRVVPFRLAQTNVACAPDPSNTFCIPGNVDEGRRDYLTVLDAFEQALCSGVNARLELLGVYKPAEVTELLRSRISVVRERYPKSVVIHESFVDPNYFDDRVRQSIALICNVLPVHVGNDSAEVYGLSKETGIRVLADVFQKRCIVSRAVPVRSRSELFSSYSHSADLAEEMGRIVERRSP